MKFSPKLSFALLLSLSQPACLDKVDMRTNERQAADNQVQDDEALPIHNESEPIPVAETVLPAQDSGDALPAEEMPDAAPATPPAPAPTTQVSEQHAISLKLDLVLAIDTSASMRQETQAIQTKLTKALEALGDGRVDAQLFLISEETIAMPSNIDSKKVTLVDVEVGSRDAISRLTNFFAGAYTSRYRDIQGQKLLQPAALRNNLRLEVVVVSDSNGEGTGNLASNFDPDNKLKATVSAITGLSTSKKAADCEPDAVGSEYADLSKKTKGSLVDICAPNFDSLILRIAEDLIRPYSTFVLEKKVSDPKSIELSLGEMKIAPEAWTFDGESNSIKLLSPALLRDGSVLSISYKTPAEKI